VPNSSEIMRAVVLPISPLGFLPQSESYDIPVVNSVKDNPSSYD